MALRLRRGTDAERLLITPVEGELIYTTDTKLLYVGDGSTAGGTLVTGAGGGGSATLDGLTDTDLTGTLDGDALTFNSSTNKWEPTAIPGIGSIRLNDLVDVAFPDELVQAGDILRFDGVFFTTVSESRLFQEQQNYKINIVGDDSTILVDTDTNILSGQFQGNVLADDDTVIIDSTAKVLTANVIGNIQGNVTGNVIGNTQGVVTGAEGSTLIGSVTGDLKGSVFGDDSTVLVDSVNSIITGNVTNLNVQTDSLLAGNIKLTTVSSNNTMFLASNAESNFFTISTEDSAGTVLISSNAQVGGVNDPVERTFRLFNSNTATGTIALTQIHNSDTGPGGSIGMARSRGTKTVPTVVQIGDVLGTYITAGFNGSTYRGAGGVRTIVSGTPESLRIPANVEIVTTKADGTNEVQLTVKNTGETVFTGAATLATYANPTARDAAIPSPVAGMMVFLTDSTGAGGAAKFQGNTDGTIGGWVDLN